MKLSFPHHSLQRVLFVHIPAPQETDGKKRIVNYLKVEQVGHRTASKHAKRLHN